MPRPRKPTHLHIVSNTYRKHRHTDREGEPTILEPLGKPPDSWPVKGKVLWGELENLIPGGVAGRSDRLAFELLVRLTAKMRSEPEDLTPALSAQIRALCGSFGMTPADRSRVTAVQSPEPNPFSRL